jgi:hypothetical protein
MVQMETRDVIIIVALVCAALLCCCVLAVGGFVTMVFELTAPVVEVGDGYFEAMKSGNYEAAYDLMHPRLQNEYGSPSDMAQDWGGARPAKWTFSQRSIENDEGKLEGSMTDENGVSWRFEIELMKEGDKWLITDISYHNVD